MLVRVAMVVWCVLATSGHRGAIYRLPKTVLPTQYKLFLETDNFGHTFSGQVIIDAEVRAKTSSIILHAKSLNITNVGLKVDQTIYTSASFNLDESRDLLFIQTSTLLQPGGRYILNISFEGQLTVLSHPRPMGYFRVKTGPAQEEWMSSTAFQMASAREAFPCWDEPEFKARFIVILTHQTTHKAVSNMPLIKSIPAEKEGWVVDHFENTPLMSPYLVAFHLLQFDSVEIKADDGRPLRLWTTQRNLSSSHAHLDFVRKTLAWFQNYTSISEPLPKIDLVEIASFPGALENWGDITFGIPENLQDVTGGIEEEEKATVAHELAHSWFGNLVTPAWWDSLWLSEGGASFMSALVVDELFPEYSHLRKITQKQRFNTFIYNLEITNQPLSPSIEYMDGLLDIPMNVYFHGFSLFNMLYHLLGTERFKTGVRRYLSALQYSTTTPYQFYKALDYQWEGRDLSKLMSEWTYRGGFPVITATRSEGQLNLTQEPFIKDISREGGMKEDILHLLTSHIKTVKDVTQWWVPITFTTQFKKDLSDSRPKLWLKGNRTIPDPAGPKEWLLLNSEASGIYVVKYDKMNFGMIQKSFNSSNYGGIPEVAREKLFLDYGLLNLRGEIDVNEMSSFHEMLSLERSERPWEVALILYMKIIQKNYCNADGHLLLVKIRKLMKSKIDERDDEGVSFRNMIRRVACEYGLPECHLKPKRFVKMPESCTTA